eukprot:494384-Pelagomonas_calceolata.AAC.1
MDGCKEEKSCACVIVYDLAVRLCNTPRCEACRGMSHQGRANLGAWGLSHSDISWIHGDTGLTPDTSFAKEACSRLKSKWAMRAQKDPITQRRA